MSDGEQINKFLEKVKEGSPEAEALVVNLEKSQYSAYLLSLSQYTANVSNTVENRLLCCILIKGAMSAKNVKENRAKQEKWSKLPQETKDSIRETASSLLCDTSDALSRLASSVLATVALHELAQSPATPSALLNGFMSTVRNEKRPAVRRAALETLSFFVTGLGELSALPLETISSLCDPILDVTCIALQAAAPVVCLAAMQLFLALVPYMLVRGPNRTPEILWSEVLQHLLFVMEMDDEAIRAVGFHALIELAARRYDQLAPFMQSIYKISISVIQKRKSSDLCKLAIVFWSTLCEKELLLSRAVRSDVTNQHYIFGALEVLVPLLTQALLHKDESSDPDDYTVSMAASTCLMRLAMHVGDDIVPLAMPFIEKNILASDWKKREAAVLAFGSILRGPAELIEQLISQATPILLEHMSDSVAAVRDTCTWTVANIIKYHPNADLPLRDVMQAICQALTDQSTRVAAKACYAMHNFALSFCDGDDESASALLSKHYTEVAKMLLVCAARAETDELDNEERLFRVDLRASGYEALAALVEAMPTSDTVELADLEILGLVLENFQNSIKQSKSVKDSACGLLFGVIQVLLLKLGPKAIGSCDVVMSLIINIFRSGEGAAVFEEAMLTVSCIIPVVQGAFIGCMEALLPHLISGLENWEAHELCLVSVIVARDVACVLGKSLEPYCDSIMGCLIRNLQQADLHPKLRPPILSAFGYIALVLHEKFVKYVELVGGLLHQGSLYVKQHLGDDAESDNADTVNALAEAICDSYVGVIQGLRAGDKVEAFYSFVSDLLQFVQFLLASPVAAQTVKRGAIGIVGDLAVACPQKVKSPATKEIQSYLFSCCSDNDCETETRKLAEWAHRLLTS